MWGLAVFLLYARRRVDCPRCGVTAELLPWADGKHHRTTAYRVMGEQVRASLCPEQDDWQYFDWEWLGEQVLRPLRAGTDADHQLHDGERNSLGRWTHVDARGVVIIEGGYSCRSEFRPLYDLTICVEPPNDVGLARLRRRGAIRRT